MIDIKCWHDGNEYELSICNQRKKSARKRARQGKAPQMPHCINCGTQNRQPELVKFTTIKRQATGQKIRVGQMIPCVVCGKLKYKKPFEAGRYTNTYCNRACYGEHMRRMAKEKPKCCICKQELASLKEYNADENGDYFCQKCEIRASQAMGEYTPPVDGGMVVEFIDCIKACKRCKMLFVADDDGKLCEKCDKK